MRIPLFPLNTVLFPDGRLPLRIFEVRYLDMINRCEAEGTPFGVVCLTTGDEVRRRAAEGEASFAPETFQAIGTLAVIEQIERPRPGLIGVRSQGGQRFRVGQRDQLAHGLWMGEVELIAADQVVAIPDDLAWLTTRLQQWTEQINARLAGTDADVADLPLQPPYRWADCGWVANRFAELLPLDASAKQNLMALQNPLLRLELVADVVEHMDSTEASGGD